MRPVFTTAPTCPAFVSMDAFRCSSAGSSRSCTCSAALTCSAVGIASLLDCPMFTWSLGCTFFPSRFEASAPITSFAFMLVEVPDPVWNTSIGNSASCCPASTSCAAATIAPATSAGSRPRSRFTSAATRLTIPSARRKARGSGRPLIGKLSTARWVVAP